MTPPALNCMPRSGPGSELFGVREYRRMTQTDPSDFDCGFAELFVGHVPHRRCPRHPHLKLRLALDELLGGVRCRGPVTMFCLLQGGRSLHEFQFQVGPNRSLESGLPCPIDRTCNDGRQVSEQ